MRDDSYPRLARAASGLAILIGLAVLLGCALDTGVFKSVSPGLATMKVNTALSFVLSGVSLWLQIEPHPSAPRARIARACALSTLVLGVLTLLEYGLGTDLGIDQLLFGPLVAEVGMPHPGRMTLATASCCVCVSVTLLLRDSRKRALETAAQLLSLVVLAVALVTMAKYSFRSAALYGFETHTGMAIHSALGLSALAIGVLASRPRVRALQVLDWPLRVKMGALLSVVSVGPLMTAAFVNTREAAKHLEDTTASLLAARSDQLVAELDGFNQTHARSAELLARAAATIGCCGDLDAMQERAVGAILATRPAADGDVRGAAILDLRGKVRLATQGRMPGLDLSYYAYVRAALQGAAVVSDVHLVAIDTAEQPTIAYLAPARRPDGTLDGVAVIWVRASALWTLMKKANGLAGGNSFAVLFDQHGIRIAHTDNDEIVFHAGGTLPRAVIDSAVAERRFGDRTLALLQDVRSFPDQFDRARADRLDGSIFRGFAAVDRQRNFGVARRLKTVRWTVFYMVPEATLLAQIAHSTRTKTLFAGLVIVLALCAGTLFATLIVGPIQALSDVTRRLARGQLDARLGNPRADELGQLGSAFNEMADRIETQAVALRSANDALEERVRQRTRDLTESEQSLSITLDSIGDAVIATDPEGRVRRMNREAEALTGWTLREALAQPLEEIFNIIHEQTKLPVVSPVAGVLREGISIGFAGPTLLVARDGQQHQIADSAAPIVAADGSIRGVVLVFRDAHVERAAAEALRVSEETYRELYENHPDMCATVDIHSETVLECNATFASQLGYAKHELVGRMMSELYDQETVADLGHLREKVRRAKILRDDERVLKRRDGSRLETSLSATIAHASDGRLLGKAVWRDISARKQAERDQRFLAELSEAQRLSADVPDLMSQVTQRLAGYLSAARSTFVEIDVEHERISIAQDHHPGLASTSAELDLSKFGAENRASQRAGKTTVVGDTSTDPRTASSFEQSYKPLGIRASVAVPLIRDGRWVSSLCVTHTESRVWQPREVALIESVAERSWLWVEQLRLTAALRDKELEALARRSEQRFRTLVEGVKDYAMLLLDPTGHVMSWNSGAERLKGYSESEIIGKHFSIFYPLEDVAAGRPDSILAIASRDDRYEEEGWRVRKDGSRFWADVLLTALRDGDNVLEGFAKVTRDRSDRREADEALRQRQAQLTASLKEREVLLQEVHHRVKNNLQVISSLINMQMRKLVDASAKAALDECKSRVEAIALIHEKLYQYKDYANVPFSDYARSLSANIFHATGISPANIELQLDITPISLAVDKAIPCGLILNELITNTLKHAFPHERDGTVRIELRKLDERTLLLVVADDGIGMPAGFDAAKSKSLGMQLVTTLVEQLEGQLEVVRGAGTQFRVTFPSEATS